MDMVNMPKRQQPQHHPSSMNYYETQQGRWQLAPKQPYTQVHRNRCHYILKQHKSIMKMEKKEDNA